MGGARRRTSAGGESRRPHVDGVLLCVLAARRCLAKALASLRIGWRRHLRPGHGGILRLLHVGGARRAKACRRGTLAFRQHRFCRLPDCRRPRLEGNLLPAFGWRSRRPHCACLGVAVGGQGLLTVALGTLPATFSSLVIFSEAIAAESLAWLLLDERSDCAGLRRSAHLVASGSRGHARRRRRT